MLKMVKFGPNGREEISDPNEFIKTLFGDLEKMKKNTFKKDEDEVEEDDTNDDIKWGMIALDNDPNATRQLLIVAPFVKQATISADIKKDFSNNYIITISWENTNLNFNAGGNFKLQPKQSLTLTGFPKLDKKNCKIFYKDGCIYLTLRPLMEKVTDHFKLTIEDK